MYDGVIKNVTHTHPFFVGWILHKNAKYMYGNCGGISLIKSDHCLGWFHIMTPVSSVFSENRGGLLASSWKIVSGYGSGGEPRWRMRKFSK